MCFSKGTRFNLTALFVAVIACIAIGRTASATIVLEYLILPLDDNGTQLSQLLDDGALQVGDKLFTDFTYAHTGNMPAADAVNIIPIMDNLGNFGIRIQGGFFDAAGDGSASDALVTFNVTALDPGMLIAGVNLLGNPAVVETDFGFASVTETFLPAIQDDSLNIFDDGTTIKLFDSVTFNTPRHSLPVQKDILLFAQGDTGITSLSFVDQTFEQILVPAPSALPAGLALMGFLFGRRRWRRGKSG